MGHPKQPGQDAAAHLEVVKKSLAQTREIAALRAELAEAREKLNRNKCNSGHTTLAVYLWDCPECVKLIRAELEEANKGRVSLIDTLGEVAQARDALQAKLAKAERELHQLRTKTSVLEEQTDMDLFRRAESAESQRDRAAELLRELLIEDQERDGEWLGADLADRVQAFLAAVQPREGGE